MPALPVPCREILAETIKDTVQRADVPLHFESFFELAAARALMMLFILLGIILFSLWRVADVAEPEPVQEVSCQKPSKLLAVDKLLQAVPISAPSLPFIGGGRTNLPEICPPYMRASQGAELSLTASTELLSQHGTKVFGLGASVMRGAPTSLLTAHALEGETRKLELREQEPGKEPGAASKVLLSTSEMDIWKGEVKSGERLGSMECTTLEGGSCFRRRFALKRDGAEQSVALSAGGTTVELGLLGSGRLMASARQSADELTITVKPDIDAVFALGCILLVVLFGMEENTTAARQSRSDEGSM